jgi:hypothetical protein
VDPGEDAIGIGRGFKVITAFQVCVDGTDSTSD